MCNAFTSNHTTQLHLVQSILPDFTKKLRFRQMPSNILKTICFSSPLRNFIFTISLPHSNFQKIEHFSKIYSFKYFYKVYTFLSICTKNAHFEGAVHIVHIFFKVFCG